MGNDLKGQRVVVTRAPAQSGRLAGLLEEWGAEVLDLPLIEIHAEVDPKIESEIFEGMAIYEWIVFTSANGVRFFFEAFFRRFKDLRCIGPCRIGCVGEATRRAVEEFRLEVDLVPEDSSGEGLAQAMVGHESLDGVKVLVVTGNRNREDLVNILEGVGHAIVDTFQVYRTEERDVGMDPVAADFRAAGADWVTFASSSTVEAFVRQAGNLTLADGAKRPKTCSIGRLTSNAMRNKHLPVDLEAPETRVDAMVAAMIDYKGTCGGGR